MSVDEERVLREVFGAAFLICSFNWHLFKAREDRGAGRVESAAAHIREAQGISDNLYDLFVAYGGEVAER